MYRKRITPATKNISNQPAIDLLIEGYDHCTRLGPAYGERKHGFNNAINALRSEEAHITGLEQAMRLLYIKSYFKPFIVSAAAGEIPVELSELRTSF